MRILLLRPYYRFLSHELPLRICEPLGLEYLVSIVRKRHEVKIYDCIAEQPDKIKEINSLYQIGADIEDIEKVIQDFKPEVVSISASFYSQALITREITKAIKEEHPEIVTMIGGSYPSSYREKTLKEDFNLDIAVMGEGEVTFSELVDNNLRDLHKIKGIIFRKNNKIFKNLPREPIRDLDSIPLPSRDAVPFYRYNRSLGPKKNIKEKISDFLMKHNYLDTLYYKFHNFHNLTTTANYFPIGSMITSRGCPNRCTFCVIRKVWGDAYRARSAQNILEEINLLVDEYRVKSIEIMDDNFTVSKRRVLDVCDGIIKRNLKITISLPSGVFLPSVDKEVLTALKEVGLREIYFGLENGNQEVLNKLIKKNLNLEHAKKIIKLSHEVGLRTCAFFILGYPGETKETMIDTIRYAYETELDSARFHIFQPLPNSEIYQYALDHHYIDKEFDLSFLRMRTARPVIRTEHFTPQDVLDIKDVAERIMRERDFSKYYPELKVILKRKLR